MTNFKVGQRVRVRKECDRVSPECAHLCGAEAQLVSVYGYREWELSLRVRGGPVIAHEDALEPLTDPKADEFIERIKKLEREPISTKEPSHAE